jgi:hypothetical protein
LANGYSLYQRLLNRVGHLNNCFHETFVFAGPFAAIGLVAYVAAINPGPGLATLDMLTAFAFMFVAPLAQFFLLRTSKVRGKNLEACTITLIFISSVALIAGASGIFNYW